MSRTLRSPMVRGSTVLLGLGVLLWLLLRAPVSTPHHGIQAYAPVQVLASRLQEPSGLARDPGTGDLYVAEADTGVILRINPEGRTETVATGFRRPRGIAWDPSQGGSLLVVDEKPGSLSRITQQGKVSILRKDLEKPQGVAVGEDGTIYVTAEERAGVKLRDPEEGALLSFPPDRPPLLLVRGLKRPEGLRALSDDRIRFLADRLRSEPERIGGTVFEYTPDDGLDVLVREGFKRPHDLSLDALYATYLTADRQWDGDDWRPEKGVIGKAFDEEGVTLFATGLKEPRGLLFDAQGNLYVAEAEAGRILKFLAPSPPTLDAQPPPVTKEATLTLTGTTEPNAVLTVRGAAVPLPPQDDVSTQVALRTSHASSNDRRGRLIYRITLTNTGKTPLASPLAIVLTNINPSEVTLANATGTTTEGDPYLEVPLLGGLLRPGERVPATLRFDGKHRHRVRFTPKISSLRPVAVSNAEGRFSFPVTLTPNTENQLELFATAHYGLGLTSPPVKLIVTHDDQPPETTITSGPAGAVSSTEAVFTFTGADTFTRATEMEFAWRLDDRSWSNFGPETSATLTGLTQGPHTFEVKARDRAGNEDLTPAQRVLTVSSLQVTITEPTGTTLIPAGRLLVRGTVEADGTEVGVTVNGFPATVQGNVFAGIVPLTPDTTMLTAVASTSSGSTTSASIAVSVGPAPPPAIILEVFPPGGVAPLPVTFHVESNTGRPLVLFELDFDGNGTDDLTSPTFDEPQHTYTTLGLFLARLRATDDQGQVYTATALVNVGGVPALEPKWEGMKDALRQGDIPKALSFIHSDTRERYEEIFQGLTPAQLASIDQYLTAIVPVEIGHNGAEYAMHRIREGERLSFPVWFQIDADGIWRLRLF